MIENSLLSYLSAQPALTALIGTRLTPGFVKEGDPLPAVAYFRVSTPREESLDGPAGLAWPRFQFSIYGNDYPKVMAVAEVIRLALAGYHGTMGDMTIREITTEGERDSYDPESLSFHRSIDFIIAHEE